MYLIAGLGNPGKQYEATSDKIGIDRLEAQYPSRRRII